MSDAFAALRPQFRARAASDLDRLTRLWADEPTSLEFRVLIHDIVGAAGILGFTDLSAVAQEINDGQVAGSRPDAEQMKRLFERLTEVAEG